MPNEELDDFFKEGAVPEPQEEPKQADVPEPVAVAPEEPAPQPEPEEPVEGEQPDRNVPLKALQAERKERQDWKEKALRMEGELAAIKTQLEAAAKVPPPAQVQQPAQQQTFPQAPSPTEDPVGFALWQQQVQFNARANMSESAIKADKSITDLEAKIAVFKQAAALNPGLQNALMLQPDPYRWAYEQGGKILAEREQETKREAAMKEIGGDPAAYREKMRAELLAELQAATPARQPPPPPQFQSLANGRSVQSRGAPIAPDISDEALFPNFR